MARQGPRVHMSLEGVAAMQETLHSLADDLQVDLVTGAMKYAAEPMRDAAKANAPDADPIGQGIVDHMFITDRLNPSQSKSEPAPRKDEVKVYVGTDRPEAHLNEWGSGPRRQKSTGRFLGEMPAKPFLRPAFDATAPQVIRRFADKIKILIEEAARKRARNTPQGTP